VLFWTMLLLPVAPAALLTGLTLGVGRVLTPSHPTSRTLTRTAFAARRTP
jgi:ABC-type phosphate transport system permease subunit